MLCAAAIRPLLNLRIRTSGVTFVFQLDPDGDLAGHLQAQGQSTCDPHWACYHTKLHRFCEEGIEFGIVPHAVGAPFAVLVAEQLFASRLRAANQRDLVRSAEGDTATAVLRAHRTCAAGRRRATTTCRRRSSARQTPGFWRRLTALMGECGFRSIVALPGPRMRRTGKRRPRSTT